MLLTELGQRIRTLMEEQGIDRVTLSERSGVPYAQLWELETGEPPKPYMDILLEIGERYSARLKELLAWKKQYGERLRPPTTVLLSPQIWDEFASTVPRLDGRNAWEMFSFMEEDLEPVICPDCRIYVPSTVPINGMT